MRVSVSSRAGTALLLPPGRPTPNMAESTREFTEKEYLLVVLVGVALLMAGTGLILVLTSV